MRIGFMRSYKKPNKLVKLLAKTSQYYNIEIVYFNAHDVDLEKEKIYGKILVNSKWKTVEMDVPPFIDLNPYVFKHKQVIKFLKKHSTLSINKPFKSKYKIYNKILEDGTFSNLIIPYENCTDYKSVKGFSKQHKQFILKPNNGLRGKNVYKITRQGRKYIIQYLNEIERRNTRQFKRFLKDNVKENKYVMQKFIPSTNQKGYPFDCRIRLEKNGEGKWEVAIYLVRIGNNKVVSNVAKGGSVSMLTPFLEANFGDRAEKVKGEIKLIAKELPYKIEQLVGQNLISLGIDLGFDQEGKPYLFEVELGPGFEFGMGEVVLIKVDYYNYLKNRLANNSATTAV
ncbi:YheC/YheD family protein [Virgibacillus sp. YIM 98842]|uniref:YheC/YheD family protein n=1 Tax=Virgibacillus sp. YIM 98842 TaxID=2663533 RepID=UPI0013DCBD2D|nr:YheC/YheD family protein [Virgibacillus sp. YIM 98842]